MMIVTRKMIREFLGQGNGYQVKIARDTNVYRRIEGGMWRDCGIAYTVAEQMAKKKGIKKFDTSPGLNRDYEVASMETLRKKGFTTAEDMLNVVKMVLGEPHDDIYRNGKLCMRATGKRVKALPAKT